MMLSRAAARPAFAAPLAIRPFSTSVACHNNSRGRNDRPVRTNPLVGNYAPTQPAQPRPEDTPPTSTENPESSQPPSPQAAPASSAEVAPNVDIPPPPPPPAASSSKPAEAPAAAAPKHAYDATAPSNPPGYIDVGKILDSDVNKVLSTFANKYAQSMNVSKDPINQPRVRSAAVTGRSVFLEGAGWMTGTAHSPEHAFTMLRRLMNESKIKGLWHRQRFHERPGLKRKRLRMERWRTRFKKGFQATATRVNELKKQGW